MDSWVNFNSRAAPILVHQAKRLSCPDELRTEALAIGNDLEIGLDEEEVLERGVGRGRKAHGQYVAAQRGELHDRAAGPLLRCGTDESHRVARAQ